VTLTGVPSSFLELSPNYKAANPEGRARWEALEHIARYDNKLMQPLMHQVTWEQVGAISCPVMLIAGGSDLSVTPTLMDYAAPKYRNAESHVINNVGHSAYWEDPRTFNALMMGFLSRHSATS
jgi:pimeloyl-ACP methyl ester carboxylesterase